MSCAWTRHPMDVAHLITDDKAHRSFVECSGMQTECLIGDDQDGVEYATATLSQKGFWKETRKAAQKEDNTQFGNPTLRHHTE